MKLAKVFGIVLGISIFLLLNNLDNRYYQASIPALDSNWSKLIFKVDAQEAQSQLQTKFITVDNDGDIQHFLTVAHTPMDALIENGYSVSNMNKVVTTSPINSLSDKAIIVLKTYRVISEDVTLSIPYERLVQGETLCQALSKKVVKQQGVLGAMTQTIKKTYAGGDLVATDITNQEILKKPINEIIILEGPDDTPNMIPNVDVNRPCEDYWYQYVDNDVSATDEEKQWLKFTMKWESGCNAGSNKDYYKGLFQWDPCIWYVQYPDDNIFDGVAQIRNTLDKLHKGGRPQYMWPAVYKRYVAQYGELSWLK